MSCGCLQFLNGGAGKALCSMPVNQIFDFVARTYFTATLDAGFIAEDQAIANNNNVDGGPYLGTPLVFAGGVVSEFINNDPTGSFPYLQAPDIISFFGEGWDSFTSGGGLFVIEFTPTGAADWQLINAPASAHDANFVLTWREATATVECQLVDAAGDVLIDLTAPSSPAGETTRVAVLMSVQGITQIAMSVNGGAAETGAEINAGIADAFTPYLYGAIQDLAPPVTLGATRLLGLYVPTTSTINIPLNPALITRATALSNVGLTLPPLLSWGAGVGTLEGYPTLTGYVGAHAAQAGDAQAVVDWAHETVYTYGSEGYLNSNALLTGVETDFALQSIYTGFSLFSQMWVDNEEALYSAGSDGLNSAICQIHGPTLAQIQTIVTAANIGNGSGTAADLSPQQLGQVLGAGDLLASEIDGIYNADAPSIGTIFDWPTPTGGNSTGASCKGPTGSSLVYVLVRPGGVPGAGNAIWLYSSNVTTTARTLIREYAPTDIDAAWTAFSSNAAQICLDSTDGNILLAIGGNGATAAYLCKVNAATGALIWKTALPAGPPGGALMQFSSITRGTYKFFQPETDFGAVPQQVVAIDTATGALTRSFIGLNGIGGAQEQAYNDTLDAIFLSLGYGGGTTNVATNSPLLVGATPGAFSGFALLRPGTLKGPGQC